MDGEDKEDLIRIIGEKASTNSRYAIAFAMLELTTVLDKRLSNLCDRIDELDSKHSALGAIANIVEEWREHIPVNANITVDEPIAVV